VANMTAKAAESAGKTSKVPEKVPERRA
jgi:hypothetical protein